MQKYQVKTIATTAFFLVAVIALGFWFYVAQRQQYKHQAEMSLLAVTELKTKSIAEWRGGNLNNAYIISKSHFLREAIAT